MVYIGLTMKEVKMFGRRAKKEEKSTNNTVENKKKQKNNKKLSKERRTAQSMFRYNIMREDGICALGDGIYSKAVSFTDINYRIASNDVQMGIISRYKDLLNSLGNGVDVSLVVNNRLVNEEDFEKRIMMPHQYDGMDLFRDEMNLHKKISLENGSNNIISDKMFVFSCKEDNILAAKKVLENSEKGFIDQLQSLGCEVESMNGTKRLESIHSVTKPKKPFPYTYDDLTMNMSTKDWISPFSFNWKRDYFEMGERYCSVLFLMNYPTNMYDSLIHDLSQIESNLLITLHMQMMSKDEAMDLINKKTQLVDIQVDNEGEKRRKRGDFSDNLPPNLRKQVESLKQWRTAVEQYDERIFNTQLVVMVNADSYDKMMNVRRDVLRVGKKNTCEFAVMEYEQEIGFNAALPLGRPIEGYGRLLLSDNVGNIMPFISQELLQNESPIFYGVNHTTNNMILCNRKRLSNSNGFILGKSGMGKSFFIKREMLSIFLSDPNVDVIVVDPQGEYRVIAEYINEYSNHKQADILEISTNTDLYFNPLEGDVFERDFVNSKADFMQMLMSEMVARNGRLSPEERSITDRVLNAVYADYKIALQSRPKDQVPVPTLATFHEYLGKIDSSVAKEMYTSMDIYVNGSYNLFAHEGNVNTNSRFLVYDIHKIGLTLQSLGFKVVLESIRNRVLENSRKGRRTYVYVDEIYLLLKDEYSENFLYEFWKWVRKYGGAATGMTQDVSDMLQSQKACTMLANSEFFIILGQDSSDLALLQRLLSLSEEQSSYLLTANKGQGLIRYANTIILFIDNFPKDTKCYEMWNTDPKEKQPAQGNEYERNVY